MTCDVEYTDEFEGGNKKGNDDWYQEYVPLADRLYDEHLAELAAEQKMPP